MLGRDNGARGANIEEDLANTKVKGMNFSLVYKQVSMDIDGALLV